MKLEVTFHGNQGQNAALSRLCVLLPDGTLVMTHDNQPRVNIALGDDFVHSFYSDDALERLTPTAPLPMTNGAEHRVMRWISWLIDSYRNTGWPGTRLEEPVVLTASAFDDQSCHEENFDAFIIDRLLIEINGQTMETKSSVACNLWKSAWAIVDHIRSIRDFWELLRAVKDEHSRRFPKTCWSESDELIARVLLRDMLVGNPTPIFIA